MKRTLGVPLDQAEWEWLNQQTNGLEISSFVRNLIRSEMERPQRERRTLRQVINEGAEQ